MKKSTLRIFTLFFFTVIFFSCTKENIDGEDVPSVHLISGTYSYSNLELELIEAINTHRKNLGLKELQTLTEAALIAEEHNYYMLEQGNVNHDNFGERYETLVKIVGAKAVSENVAYGYRTAEAVMKAWLKSEGHEKNIVGEYTHHGISARQDEDGKNYFTNIFLKK